MIHGKPGAMLDKFLMVACIVAIGAFLINQIDDPDIWWHVAIGRDILASHAVPVTDHFAASTFGRPYHDSQWLFQVVTASIDRAIGIGGIQALMILGWTAILWLLHRTIMRHVPPLTGYLLLFIAAMASVERFLPRPEVVSLLMIVLFYWLLQERKYLGLKGLLLFGLLQVIWTNSHGLFVIGPFMVGCYWFATALSRMRGGEQDFAPLSRLLGVLLLATLLNPYGWEGWQFAIQLASEVGPWAPKILEGMTELSPTLGAASRTGVAFWFLATLIAAVVLTAIPTALRRQVSLARLLIVAGLLVTALSGRRNMPIFALVAAPFVAENLRLLFPQDIKNIRINMALSTVLALAMLAWSWYPISGYYYLNMKTASRFGWGASPSLFPRELPQILERTGFKGQIYHSSFLGGYYMYHSYPERIPLTDGRFELYDLKVMAEIDKATLNPEAWGKLVSAYDIRGLLLQHASYEALTLLPMLRAQDTWRLVYFDNTISFWMRSDTPQLPPAIDLATAVLPPMPDRPEECFMLNEFLHIMGADELELQGLQRALEFGWQMESLLVQISRLQIRLKRIDQVEATLERLLRDYPRNLYALNELGFLAYYRKGDLVTAEALLRRALEIAPDDPDIRNNHLRIKAALDRSMSRAAQGQAR